MEEEKWRRRGEEEELGEGERAGNGKSSGKEKEGMGK